MTAARDPAEATPAAERAAAARRRVAVARAAPRAVPARRARAPGGNGRSRRLGRRSGDRRRSRDGRCHRDSRNDWRWRECGWLERRDGYGRRGWYGHGGWWRRGGPRRRRWIGGPWWNGRQCWRQRDGGSRRIHGWPWWYQRRRFRRIRWRSGSQRSRRDAADGLELVEHVRVQQLNETLIKQIADTFVSSGMKDAGYQYVNLDDCWMDGRDSSGKLQLEHDQVSRRASPRSPTTSTARG